MHSVYFDSSVFLALFKGENDGVSDIRQLLRELKKGKVRIVTSIITIQEVAVSNFRHGTPTDDNHIKVNKLARVESITRDMALTAAKYEANLIEAQAKTAPQKGDEAASDKKRRKWDCFHISCAVHLKCDTLYSMDAGMLKRKQQFNIPTMEFLKPIPIGGVLPFEPMPEDFAGPRPMVLVAKDSPKTTETLKDKPVPIRDVTITSEST